MIFSSSVPSLSSTLSWPRAASPLTSWPTWTITTTITTTTTTITMIIQTISIFKTTGKISFYFFLFENFNLPFPIKIFQIIQINWILPLSNNANNANTIMIPVGKRRRRRRKRRMTRNWMEKMEMIEMEMRNVLVTSLSSINTVNFCSRNPDSNPSVNVTVSSVFYIEMKKKLC